jgi:hypothetical protein
MVMAACSNDVTSPARAARAFSLAPLFPRSFQQVPFSSVRAALVSASGTVVADTTVTFPASADSIVLQFDMPVPAASAGEPLDALVWCIDAAGDTVFKGGPVPVVPTTGQRASPTVVPLVYTGSGGGGGGGGDSTGTIATALAIAAQPVTSVAGAALTLIVDAVDSLGHAVTSFSGPITVALGANPGSATLGGTLTANAVDGVATFANVLLTKAASAYTLVAATSGLTSATSHAFNISPGAPSSITKQGGDNQSGLLALAGILLANPLSVLVTDAYGNPVSGTTVNWVVSAGDAALGSATSTTNSSGIATNSLTLLRLVAGVDQVTASLGGTAGSVIFSETGLL